MKPYTKNLRRPKDLETKSMNVTLPEYTLVDLEHYGIKSGRGSGNLSAVVGIALRLLMGVFDDPDTALNSILELVDVEKESAHNDIGELAENCLEVGKLLYDYIEED